MVRPAALFRILLGTAATAAFIWLLLRDVHLGEVARTLARANPVFVPAILAVYLFRFWLRSLRWSALVSHLRRVEPMAALPRVVLSQGANLVLPFQLGYGVMIQISAERFRLSRSHLLGAEAIERLMDGITFAAFLALAIPFLPVGDAFLGLAAFMVFGTATGAVLAYVASAPVPPLPALRVARREGTAVGRILEGMAILHHPRQRAVVAAYSAAIWLTEGVLFWLTAAALGIEASPMTYLFLVAAANIGAAIPIAQSGAGFLFVAQQALRSVGEDPEVATAFVFALQGVLSLPFVVLGPLAAWWMRLRLSDLLPWRHPGPVTNASESGVAPLGHGGL